MRYGASIDFCISFGYSEVVDKPSTRLFLFGAPRLERRQRRVAFDTRKALALLAYLALTRAAHSRDSLANLLWSDYPQSKARAALRRTLSVLNAALGAGQLDIERETIALADTAHLWLDVDEYRRALAACEQHSHAPRAVCAKCVEPLTQAAEIYRGDFLAGFSLRDAPNFDEWQFFQTENLRRDFAGALERLTQSLTDARDDARALEFARRWLALDPLHEPAHRALMQLYTATHQRAAALRQYRECVRVLEKELNVAPLEETTRVYEEIKRGVRAEERAATSPARLHSPAPLPSHTPFVGRAAELSACRAAYEKQNAKTRLFIIEGEQGIGKTRLAEEFLRHARGAPILATRCYEGEKNFAYAPIAEMLRAALALMPRAKEIPAAWLGEIARLAPEIYARRADIPPAPALDSPGAQAKFFESIALFLAALAGSSPPILFIDDLQWADEATLDWLTYWLRHQRERALFILATWRTEPAPPDPRWLDLLAEAHRNGAAIRVSLPRLNENAVNAWIDSAEKNLPAELRARVVAETEGLPFFVAEYLAAFAGGAVPGEIPGTVRQVLRARLGAVNEIGLQLLTTASVIGRSFDFDTLRAASGRGEEETLAGLEALCARGLIQETRRDDAPTYDFIHGKLRELVYSEMLFARRRVLHRRVAESLAERAGAPNDARAAHIAQHFQLAGEDARAADYFKRAGDYARALFANREALTHYLAARALGHSAAAALHESIGDVEILLGEYRAAIHAYETSAAITENSALARLEHKLGTVRHRRGEWELAETHFQTALSGLGKKAGGEHARIYADWSLTAHQRGDAARAFQLARRALTLADKAGDPRARAQAHNLLGILARSRDDFDGAQNHLEESGRIAETLGDASAHSAALNNLALVHRARQDFARAIALTESALALCARTGDQHRQAALHNNLADLLHTSGNRDAAMAQLKQAAALFAEIGAEAGTLQPEIWKLVEW